MKPALLCISVLALLAGCKKSSGASATIGATGGFVSLAGGPSVAVPPGALASGVTLTIQQSAAAAPAGALSRVYTFGPEGTVFAKPVTVNMPVPEGTATASLFWTKQGSTTAYDAIPGLVTSTTLIAQVSHFSSGFAGAYCKEGGACAPANVCRTGTFTCDTGTASCPESGNQPDGKACETSKVCNAGTCAGCAPNLACTPSGTRDPCKVYKTSCDATNTVTSCGITGDQPDGTVCAAGSVCSAGACVTACVAGQACTPAGTPDICDTYATACNATLTQTTCAAIPKQNGTSCGTNLSCSGGACVASRTVSSAFTREYWPDAAVSPSAPVKVPQTGLTVGALVQDGSASGWQSFPGTLNADGSFTVAGVPNGNYYLSLDYGPANGGVSLVPLTTSTPDLSTVVSRRSDVVFETSVTNMTLTLSGLDPWTQGGLFAGDLFQITSSQASVSSRPFQFGGVAPPAAGATSYTGTFDWTAGTDDIPVNGLPSSAKGDAVYFHQSAHGLAGTGPLQASVRNATKFAKLTNLTVFNGSPFSLGVSLSAAPQTGSFNGDVRYSQFDALRAGMNPHATRSALYLGIFAWPHSITFPDAPGPVACQLFILAKDLSGVTGTITDYNYGTIAYGQFLDAPWTVKQRQLEFQGAVSFTAPGATPSTWITEYLGLEDEAAVSGSAVAPVLGPPGALQINGADAFTAQAGVGLQPTFSWTAPALGTPTSYSVFVSQVSNQSGATAFTSVLFAVVYGATSFKMPPGILATGKTYLANIASRQATWDAVDAPWFRGGSGYHGVDAVTATFTP